MRTDCRSPIAPPYHPQIQNTIVIFDYSHESKVLSFYLFTVRYWMHKIAVHSSSKAFNQIQSHSNKPAWQVWLIRLRFDVVYILRCFSAQHVIIRVTTDILSSVQPGSSQLISHLQGVSSSTSGRFFLITLLKLQTVVSENPSRSAVPEILK